MRSRPAVIGALGTGALASVGVLVLPTAAAASPRVSGDSQSSPSAGGQAPPGNNGTIKIDGYKMDAGQDNDAHVACGFSVSFFGYDAGTQHASITVTPWAPTRGGHPATYQTGWTTASRSGGNQFDANYPVSSADVAAVFSGVSPAHQGYHARIEVEVTGSRGSDDKFKMVWIKPCSSSGPAATAPVAGTSATAAPAGPAAAPAVATQSLGTPAVGTSVLGETLTAPASTAGSTGTAGGPATVAAASVGAPAPVGASTAPAGVLAFTGGNIAAETATGLGLIGAGLALNRRRTRARRR